METSLKDYLATAIHAARAAGKLQQFYVNGELEIDTKSSNTDLVTHADKACEAKIREIILAAYPDHAILGEEEGQSEGTGKYRWIVDPIDGTLNFAHGFPFYCVSIALEIDGIVQVGVVLDATRDELFTAVRGQGAFCNGSPIACTSEGTLGDAMLATGFAYTTGAIHDNVAVFAKVLPKVRSVRRPGAAALDLCYVACGRLDGFWELTLQPWDVAAGMLIIQEAGGTVTGGGGEPYKLDNPVVVATNGHLHAKLLGILELGTVYA